MKKNTINLAHEAPVSIMPQVQMVTDYDYALSVLFDKVDGYYDFFVDAKKKGRWVLLDNGIFEEGVPMEAGKYADWIAKLNPDEYIVPDALEDTNTTISNFERWLKDFGDLPGRKIGVAQGRTLKEFTECYRYMSEKADKIAISFDYSLYINEVMPQVEGNKWMKWARGRMAVFELLYMTNVLNLNKPHHLLGIGLPSELRTYSNAPFGKVVESFDSSNPVVYGIVKGQYPKSIFEVTDKISVKLKDLVNTPKSDKLIVDTIANITKFRVQNGL